MSEHILVVDDEKEIADLVAFYLKNEGYQVYTCYSADDALHCIETKTLDLAILDIMMPETNGFALCQKIREKYTYPVLMLTAKDEEIDKITGLTLGADDYVTKPFRPLELVARVKAQLRRYKRYNQPTEVQDSILVVRGLVINTDSHECVLDEKPLSLTPTEFTILKTLCEQKNRVVSAEQLFYEVWGDEYYNRNNNTIAVHVRHIREKMTDSVDNPKYIKTVWGVGYKIEE